MMRIKGHIACSSEQNTEFFIIGLVDV